jgi:hypothetical protein
MYVWVCVCVGGGGDCVPSLTACYEQRGVMVTA